MIAFKSGWIKSFMIYARKMGPLFKTKKAALGDDARCQFMIAFKCGRIYS
jgi:hypothetical protein